MKIYRVKSGILIQDESTYYLHADSEWDRFINDDNLLAKLKGIVTASSPINSAEGILSSELMAPIGNQEVWACGVTYFKSKVGRQEESKDAGGGDFYGRVYEAERPEVFFKATPHRVVGSGKQVRIRKDSTWDVPEPELTLVVASSGKIVGYTVGNDMSSRSIEGENPLYLPQAKTYDGCAAVGPCIYVTDEAFPDTGVIRLEIFRGGKSVFDDNTTVSQMKRKPKELVSFVFKEASFPDGCLVMTGTGIVPGSDFTLQSGDEIKITIDHIGTLVNKVA